MYLNNLAKEILKNVPEGISKVKFAKILYFVHKSLVLENLSEINDLKFIRMPLGPVPVGFKDLYNDKDITIEKTSGSLSYNMQIYKIVHANSYLGSQQQQVITSSVKSLITFPTSELVEVSHQEPSWIKFANGSEYFISKEDLDLALPTQKKDTLSTEIDNQRLQARLVEGMLDDIVLESTALEYPDLELNKK